MNKTEKTEAVSCTERQEQPSAAPGGQSPPPEKKKPYVPPQMDILLLKPEDICTGSGESVVPASNVEAAVLPGVDQSTGDYSSDWK